MLIVFTVTPTVVRVQSGKVHPQTRLSRDSMAWHPLSLSWSVVSDSLDSAHQIQESRIVICSSTSKVVERTNEFEIQNAIQNSRALPDNALLF